MRGIEAVFATVSQLAARLKTVDVACQFVDRFKIKYIISVETFTGACFDLSGRCLPSQSPLLI